MTTLQLPTQAARAAINDSTQWGTAHNVESGGFFLTAIATSTVTAVAVAAKHGVLRRRDQFVITGPALETLSEWAEYNQLRIAAQYHSHAHGTALSPIDRAGGIRVHGFMSAVIPTFTNPDVEPDQWGWWQFDTPNWIAATPPRVTPASDLTVIRFDESGIDAR